jgi:hypothetical protein
MKKIIGMIFGSMALMLTNNVFAEPPLGMHVTYDFSPEKQEEFQSPLPWKVDVKCKVTTEDPEAPIEGKLLSSDAVVNGKKYHTHDTLVLPVHTGDSFKIKAGSFIKVRLTNKGEHNIHVDCDV